MIDTIEQVVCERCIHGTEIDDEDFGGYALGDDDGIFTGLYCNYHDKPVYFGGSCVNGKEKNA